MWGLGACAHRRCSPLSHAGIYGYRNNSLMFTSAGPQTAACQIWLFMTATSPVFFPPPPPIHHHRHQRRPAHPPPPTTTTGTHRQPCHANHRHRPRLPTLTTHHRPRQPPVETPLPAPTTMTSTHIRETQAQVSNPPPPSHFPSLSNKRTGHDCHVTTADERLRILPSKPDRHRRQ